MNEPKRVGFWSPKLTDEAREWAMTQLACDVPSTVVAQQVLEKFNIQITDCRLRVIRDSKKGFPIYDAARAKYLAKKANMDQIEVACQISRVREASNIAKKLAKLVGKVETKIDELTDDGLDDGKIKYIVALGRTLKDTALAYKDFLSYVKEEVAPKSQPSKGLSGSFLAQIEVKKEPEQKVIDADVVEPNASSDE